MTAVLTGPWPKIENVIRCSHDFGIVFDDEHRVSDVPQPQQNFNQALGIAWMKPDRRFIEDIQGANQ